MMIRFPGGITAVSTDSNQKKDFGTLSAMAGLPFYNYSNILMSNCFHLLTSTSVLIYVKPIALSPQLFGEGK